MNTTTIKVAARWHEEDADGATFVLRRKDALLLGLDRGAEVCVSYFKGQRTLTGIIAEDWVDGEDYRFCVHCPREEEDDEPVAEPLNDVCKDIVENGNSNRAFRTLISRKDVEWSIHCNYFEDHYHGDVEFIHNDDGSVIAVGTPDKEDEEKVA